MKRAAEAIAVLRSRLITRHGARRSLLIAFAALVCALGVVLATVLMQPAFDPAIVLAPHDGFVINGEYPSAATETVHGARYGSWNGSDTKTGTLASQSFRAPAMLAMTLSGYPSHPGETIELVREDGPRTRLRLDTGADPRERWESRLVIVPRPWRGIRVHLLLTDAGTGYGDWLGIGDVHAASLRNVLASDFLMLASDRRLPLLAFGALVGVLVFPCIGIGSMLCTRLGLSDIVLFPCVLLVLGIAAEATFFLTMIADSIATMIVWAATIAGSVLTIRALKDTAFRRRVAEPDAWVPFAIAGLTGMAYLALFCLAIGGSESAPGAAERWLELPPDNVLPHILADRIRAHATPKPFLGDWLSSDRPPLQGGFDLLFGAILPFGADSEARYQALSVLLQTAIFGVLFALCRVIGCSRLRATGIVILSLPSTFFFLNSVFVWPKLVAGAFMATAMVLVLASTRPPSLSRSIAIGVAAGLGLLSHGGVVFTVPALLVAWLVSQRFAALRPMVVASVTIVIVMAPWTWYQRVYDPPGDRLLKWHLAGQIPVSTTPFSTAFVRAYTTVPPATLMANKVANIAAVMGIDTPAMALAGATREKREFFCVRFALGALLLPYLAALLCFRSRRPLLRSAASFALIAFGATLFWCLAMYAPGSTSVHQGSYLTMLLMFLAGGIIATQWTPVFVVVLAFQAYLFAVAWFPMFGFTTLATPGGWFSLLVLVSAVGCAFTALRRHFLASTPRFIKTAFDKRAMPG